jgi:hypothetical protein
VTGLYPKCRDNRSASAASVRTGSAAELKGITAALRPTKQVRWLWKLALMVFSCLDNSAS